MQLAANEVGLTRLQPCVATQKISPRRGFYRPRWSWAQMQSAVGPSRLS